jgi:hypothetical protein
MSAIFPCRSLLASALLALGVAASAQTGNVAINANGAPAQPTALLDVSSVSQGIFLPRFPSLPAAAALPDGLTVYKTGAGRGFYVVQSGAWVMLQPGNDGWDLYGNYLTNPINPNPDFIGTTDNRPMYFRTNNLHRMRLDATTGFLGVGYPAATSALERLDINGALRQYYIPSPGVETSNTNTPGTFRYQTYGTPTGAFGAQYGSREKLATNPNTAAVNLAVLGTTRSYPLQYAAHWGNIGDTSMRQGVTTPVVTQPKTNGWRAFENPYTEETANWSHFKEAVCATGNADIPSGVTPIWSNNAVVPNVGAPPVATDQELVTPFLSYANFISWRRQYLFRKEELNLELGEVAGNTPTAGICPGEEIDQIGFYVYSPRPRAPSAGTNFSVTVRHAPTGLNDLIGFDNSSVFPPATISCGIYPGGWPNGPVGSFHWEMVALSPPFVWNGTDNILIEVAVRSGPTASANIGPNNPVYCTNTGFNATFGAHISALTWTPAPGPPPSPSCSCNDANTTTRMQDSAPLSVAYASGSSQWRPMVRFHGTVGTPSTAITSGTANYITYPGGLIIEDSSSVDNGTDIPWGRWRPSLPTGNSYWSFNGNGTISAQRGVYDNGSLLNDHVFDRAFDGRVAPTDAARFGGQRLLGIKEMAEFTRENRHLPTMKGRKDWNREGGFSLGDLGNQLWATTETQALYIADLHDKLNVIEMLGSDRPVSVAEFRLAAQELSGMAQFTDAEKVRLIADLRKRAPLTPPSK